MPICESTASVPDGGGWVATPSDPDNGAVLVPIVTDRLSDQALGIAVDIAEYEQTTLIVVGMETVPEQTPLDHPTLPIESHKWAQTYAQKAKGLGSPSLEVTAANRIGRHIGHMILREVDDRGVKDLVMEQTDETSASASLLGDPMNSVFESGECDILLTTGAEYLDDISSILVPIAGGPHSGLAVDVANALAEENNAWLELFHVIDPGATAAERQRGERYIDAAMARLGDFENVDTWLYEAPDIAEGIIEQTRYYSVTVLGAPQKSRLKRFIFGSKTDAVRERADSTVITVRSAESGGAG